jgi:hypothetical protein
MWWGPKVSYTTFSPDIAQELGPTFPMSTANAVFDFPRFPVRAALIQDCEVTFSRREWSNYMPHFTIAERKSETFWFEVLGNWGCTVPRAVPYHW